MASIPHSNVSGACSVGPSSVPDCMYARVANTRDAGVRIPVQHHDCRAQTKRADVASDLEIATEKKP